MFFLATTPDLALSSSPTLFFLPLPEGAFFLSPRKDPLLSDGTKSLRNGGDKELAASATYNRVNVAMEVTPS